MNNFKRINFMMGWLTFAISAIVYFLTMEPSASLWDCGEFISTSYKMQIGHPPGAPLFMMINRLFSMFALDTSYVAATINFVSVIASALTIMFLYWTIAHLALKLIGKTRETALPKDALLVYGSAFVGAMAYAFTDTFWFSAVEGEVYAQSSLFTAMVVWAMLKWENESDKVYSSRWLILISYLMGLSIGVHLLNLLTIPALVMVYHYKNSTKRNALSWWKAFGVSVIILAFVLFLIIPKTVELGAWVDRFFANSLGTGKNIGLVFYCLTLLGLFAFGVYYTHKKQKHILNTMILCLGVLLVGFGTYASVIIRSSQNPPLNSNQPDDAYSLVKFLNREQYGYTPLLWGQYYSSPLVNYEQKTVWNFDEKQNKYVSGTEIDYKTLEYAPGTSTFFPRMYSDTHASQYGEWVDIKGKTVRYNNKNIVVPTFAENLEFFFKYQVNYMYWRYFLWNFVGRQNDNQGDGSSLNGNWISGIEFIDQLYVGTSNDLPSELKENKSRNTYFFLPFLLGLAGLVYQLSKNRDDFVIVTLLFLMTGLAIILYLNQKPSEARERDYAYAGSFYAFSIWIGLGVFWLQSILSKFIKNIRTSQIAAIVIAMIVPTVLLAQNWDDHDRSHRYVAPDFGKNYLESCLPNTVLMPYGDNDTFGPWYAQEVEGVRTDVRICNLSYIQSNWYAIQMKYKFNESLPIRFTIPERVYGSEDHNFLPVVPLKDDFIPLKEALDFIAIDSPAKKNLIKSIGFRNENVEIFPANKIAIPVNKQNALKAGIITEKDLPNVVDTIYVTLKKESLGRPEYLLLDMIATSDWSRPISFTQFTYGVGEIGLSDYLQFDGFTYRLVPIKTSNKQLKVGQINSEYLYDVVMNKFSYGNISDPRVHLDIFNANYIKSVQLRAIFARLAIKLVEEGKMDKAKEVMARSLKEIPFEQIGHDYFTPITVEALHLVGDSENAQKILEGGVDYCMQYMNYIGQFDTNSRFDFTDEIGIKLQIMMMLYREAEKYGYKEQADRIKPYVEMYLN